MENNIIITIILAMSIPSLIAGFGVWNLKRTIVRYDIRREKKDKDMKEYQLLILKGNFVAIRLAEEAVKAIRDNRTNGTLEESLEYAKKIKEEQRSFIEKKGLESIYR